MTLKIGMFGAGRIGKVHAASIRANPQCELTAVTDVMSAAAADLAAASGARVATPDEILSDPAIGAILIASSTDTHADLIEAGIKAGKAVFCEKPIDLDLTRARRCEAAVAASGLPVMLGFNRRFDPNFAAMKAAYDAGEIGKGELLTITSFDPAPPPVAYIGVSGGLFRDMAIHDLDLAAWMFGDLPEKVTATGTCVVDPGIGAAGDIDTAVIVLHFSGGRLATIRNSRRASYGYDQRAEMLGSDGLLAAENMLENTVVKSTKDGVTGAKPMFFFLERYMRAYEEEMRQFVEAVVNGAPLPTTVTDGVNALALAEAANISLRDGRTVAMTEVMGAS